MKDQKLPSSIQQENLPQELGAASLVEASHDICVSSIKNKHLEDLPDEVILNVLNFLQLPDLIHCGLVSKRIRSVSFIESLWQKIDILNSDYSMKTVSIDLVKRIINRGCKSLSLKRCNLTGKLKCLDFDSNFWTDYDEKIMKMVSQVKNPVVPTTPSVLSYAQVSAQTQWIFDSRSDFSDFESKYRKDRNLAKEIITETKMGGSRLISLDLIQCVVTPYMFPIICNQNGQNLQTLDLTFTIIKPCDLMHIVTNCVGLKEVDFSGCRLSKNCMDLLVNNLSPNVEKLGLGAFGIDAKDKHIVALVSRCNKITSLNLAFRAMLSDVSLTSIMENLRFTLEVLDVDYCQNLTNTKLIEMRSMPQLKVLNYSMPQGHYEKLKMHLPQLTNDNFWRQKWMDLLET